MSDLLRAHEIPLVEGHGLRTKGASLVFTRPGSRLEDLLVLAIDVHRLEPLEDVRDLGSEKIQRRG